MYKPDGLKIRRRTWFQLANIPVKSTGWRLEDCNDLDHETQEFVKSWVLKVQAKKVIRAYGEKLAGKGLFFTGDPGYGKSTLASAVLQEMLTTFSLEQFSTQGSVLIRPCYFASYNEVLDLKGRIIGHDTTEFEEKLFQGLLGDCADDAHNVRVFVIDDVDKHHFSASGWQKTLLNDIIRRRYSNGLPTIVTTNVAAKDIKDMYGDAAGSFLNEAFIPLTIKSSRGDLRLGT